MKILIDMNLSPSWVTVFEHQSWEATHWSDVGNPTASDTELLEWCASNQFVLFTHDLDFGLLLLTRLGRGPSVIQLRSQETSPVKMGATVVSTIRQVEDELEKGALVTIDPVKARIRLLPLA